MKPRVYRSTTGCCICRAKSSSSRFTDSDRFEADFAKCFLLTEPRSGKICNACVLLVKRFKNLPPDSTRTWEHVIDARAGPGVKSMVKHKKKLEALNNGNPVDQSGPSNSIEKFPKIRRKVKPIETIKSIHEEFVSLLNKSDGLRRELTVKFVKCESLSNTDQNAKCTVSAKDLKKDLDETTRQFAETVMAVRAQKMKLSFHQKRLAAMTSASMSKQRTDMIVTDKGVEPLKLHTLNPCSGKIIKVKLSQLSPVQITKDPQAIKDFFSVVSPAIASVTISGKSGLNTLIEATQHTQKQTVAEDSRHKINDNSTDSGFHELVPEAIDKLKNDALPVTVISGIAVQVKATDNNSNFTADSEQNQLFCDESLDNQQIVTDSRPITNAVNKISDVVVINRSKMKPLK